MGRSRVRGSNSDTHHPSDRDPVIGQHKSKNNDSPAAFYAGGSSSPTSHSFNSVSLNGLPNNIAIVPFKEIDHLVRITDKHCPYAENTGNSNFKRAISERSLCLLEPSTWEVECPANHFPSGLTLGQEILFGHKRWAPNDDYRGYATQLRDPTVRARHERWIDDILLDDISAEGGHVAQLTRAGILEGLLLSYGHYNRDISVQRAVLECWCPETNTFHTRFGEMSITVLDMKRLFGLPITGLIYDEWTPSLMEAQTTYLPDGNPVHPQAYTELCMEFDKLMRLKARGRVTTISWLNNFVVLETDPPANQWAYVTDPKVRISSPTYLAALIVYWLCRFVLQCQRGDIIRKECLLMATYMASGVPFALGPAALALLYRSLRLIHSDPTQRVQFSGHYLFHWIACYFGEHTTICRPASRTHPLLVKWNVQALMGRYMSYSSVDHQELPHARAIVRDDSYVTWTPYYFEGCTDEYSYFPPGHVLSPTEFEYLISVREGYLSFRMGGYWFNEPYLPSRFARQFGLDQAVPLSLLPPLSRFADRLEDLYESTVWFHRPLNSEYFLIGFGDNSAVATIGYATWWKTNTDPYFAQTADISRAPRKKQFIRSLGNWTLEAPLKGSKYSEVQAKQKLVEMGLKKNRAHAKSSKSKKHQANRSEAEGAPPMDRGKAVLTEDSSRYQPRKSSRVRRAGNPVIIGEPLQDEPLIEEGEILEYSQAGIQDPLSLDETMRLRLESDERYVRDYQSARENQGPSDPNSGFACSFDFNQNLLSPAAMDDLDMIFNMPPQTDFGTNDIGPTSSYMTPASEVDCPPASCFPSVPAIMADYTTLLYQGLGFPDSTIDPYSPHIVVNQIPIPECVAVAPVGPSNSQSSRGSRGSSHSNSSLRRERIIADPVMVIPEVATSEASYHSRRSEGYAHSGSTRRRLENEVLSGDDQAEIMPHMSSHNVEERTDQASMASNASRSSQRNRGSTRSVSSTHEVPEVVRTRDIGYSSPRQSSGVIPDASTVAPLAPTRKGLMKAPKFLKNLLPAHSISSKEVSSAIHKSNAALEDMFAYQAVGHIKSSFDSLLSRKKVRKSHIRKIYEYGMDFFKSSGKCEHHTKKREALLKYNDGLSFLDEEEKNADKNFLLQSKIPKWDSDKVERLARIEAASSSAASCRSSIDSRRPDLEECAAVSASIRAEAVELRRRLEELEKKGAHIDERISQITQDDARDTLTMEQALRTAAEEQALHDRSWAELEKEVEKEHRDRLEVHDAHLRRITETLLLDLTAEYDDEESGDEAGN